MRKILIVIGTRPEAIKIAPVIKALEKVDKFSIDICNTGQHREMLDQVLDLFEIRPKYNLFVMKKSQTLASITSEIISGLQNIFANMKYNLIIVHGDTTTCFAASLVAFYNRIPIAHVEAGLRTGNLYAPWPEEFNRQAVGRLVKLHFAPTVQAKRNLIEEGVSKEDIFVTGNTVIDALSNVQEKIQTNQTLRAKLYEKYIYLNNAKKLILVTGHRRENFGEGFESICKAIRQISVREDVEFIYPLHLNPNVKIPVEKILGGCRNIHLIKPVDYVDFVYLMMRSYLILTDSGGVQEEAPYLGKPVILMRDVTERPDAIASGIVKLVGTNTDVIAKEIIHLLEDANFYSIIAKKNDLYGDGCAAEKICIAVTEYLN